MAAEWYCYIAGREFGPLSAQDLRTMVAEGSLTPRHHVRRGTSGPWVEAGQVKGLFAASGSQQTIPAPPVPTASDAMPAAVAASVGPPTLPAAAAVGNPAEPSRTTPSNSAVFVSIPPAAAAIPVAQPIAQPAAAAPQAAVVPQAVLPQGGPPLAAIPQAGVPQAVMPQQAVPRAAPVAAAIHSSTRASAASRARGAVSGAPTAVAEQGPRAELSPEKLLAARRKKTNKVLFLSGVSTIGASLLIALAIFFWPRGSSRSELTSADPNTKASPADELDPLKASKPSTPPSAPPDSADSNTASNTASSAKASDDAQPAAAGSAGATEVKWTPVSAAVERGGIEVRVEQIGPGKPALYPEKGSGGRRTFRNPMLVVKLVLKNVSGNPSVVYKPWGYSYEGVSLKDDRGRTIMPAPIRSRGLLAEGQQDQPEVRVEQIVEDLLVFEIPRDAVRHLRLFLSGTALGAAEPIGFEIPATALREFESAKRPGGEPSGSEKPIIPGRSAIGEIDRAIDEIEREKPAGTDPPKSRPGAAARPADQDPAGDVSKINRDIEELEKERGGMMNDGKMGGGRPSGGNPDGRMIDDRKMNSP